MKDEMLTNNMVERSHQNYRGLKKHPKLANFLAHLQMLSRMADADIVVIVVV